MNFDEDLGRASARLHLQQISAQDFIDSCARIAVVHIGCTRAGIWLFRRCDRDDDMALECVSLYDSRIQRLVRAPGHSQAHARSFIEEIGRAGVVMAPDARRHLATRSLFENTPPDNGVRSLLAAALTLNGAPLGAFSCTQIGASVVWNDKHLQMIRTIGAKATVAISRLKRSSGDPFSRTDP